MNFTKQYASCIILFAFISFHDIKAQNTEEILLESTNVYNKRNESTVNYPQSISPYKLSIKVESTGILSGGDNAPFWFTNNNDGIGSLDKNKAYLRAGIFGNRYFFDEKLNIDYGADIVAAHNIQTDFYIQQLYTDFKYRALGLTIGSKRYRSYYLNEALSSGGLNMSSNARPIPQVLAGIPDFVNIPLTKNWLQVVGGVSFGKFLDGNFNEHFAADGRYTKNTLYHRKFMYLKIENKTPWNFIIGLDMNSQWGGDRYINGKFVEKGPTQLKDIIKVLLPMSGGGEANEADQQNILGNVNGSWHFVFRYNKPNYTLKLYHDHFFEDHSGFYLYKLKNIPDGLYGLEFDLKKKQLISAVLFEFLYTKSQSGDPRQDSGIPDFAKGDNYYNHYFYNSFTYYGHILANPLIVSPLYNQDRRLLIESSRTVSYHLGVSGYFHPNASYRLLLCYSRGYGTFYGEEIFPRLTHFSAFGEINYTNSRLNDWVFTGALGYDNSRRWIGNNVGFRLKIAKSFMLK